MNIITRLYRNKMGMEIYTKLNGTVARECIQLLKKIGQEEKTYIKPLTVYIVDGELGIGCNKEYCEAFEFAVDKGINFKIYCGPWLLDEYDNGLNGNELVRYLSSQKPKNVSLSMFKSFRSSSPVHFMIAELTSIIETPHFPASESISNGSVMIENSSRWQCILRNYLTKINATFFSIASGDSINYLKSKEDLQTLAEKEGEMFWKSRPYLRYSEKLQR